MTFNKETRTVLAFAKHRLAGLLHTQLRSFGLSRAAYAEIFRGTNENRDIAGSVRDLLLETSRNDEFWTLLASRIPPVLANVFWMELSEQLILAPKCEFNNFGIFARTFSLGRLVVSFDSRLSAEYRRTTSTSQFHKDPFESAISHHCDYVLEGIHRELWAWSDFGSFQAWRIPLILTHILSAALPRAVGNFLSDERAIAKCAEYSRSSDAQQFDPLFLVLGAFISAVAYEGWTVAFAMELLGGSEIEIEGIGKFHHMNLKSSFECDQNLLRLIEANLQGQAMAA